MTREHKLALIVGFSLFLVLGVLISDHFSKARQVAMAENIQPASSSDMGASPPGVRLSSEPGVTGAAGAGTPIPLNPGNAPVRRTDLVALPGMGTPSPAMGGTLVVAPQRTAPSVALAGTNVTQLPAGGDPSADAPDQASTPAAPANQIPLLRHEVKEGDTLYRIAVKYYGDGKLWEKVRDYNKERVSGAGLREGVTLLIPPRDVLLGKPSVPTAQAGPAPTTIVMDGGRGGSPAAKPAGDYREYVVREGDTLVAIARKMLSSGKRYPEIIDANKGALSDPEALKIGMKLRIPAK